MYDAVTYHRLATDRQRELRTEARNDALASLARCCKSSAARARDAAAGAWNGTVAFLRRGQLGDGYVRDCCA